MIQRRGIALMLVNFADPLGHGIAALGPVKLASEAADDTRRLRDQPSRG